MYSSLDNNRILQLLLYFFIMATARERRRTEHETDEIMSNSQSGISSQDELLMGFDCTSSDSDDEDLPSEGQWRCGVFTPSILQFLGKPRFPNIISLVGKPPVDYFLPLCDEAIIERMVDETNRYYLQNPTGER